MEHRAPGRAWIVAVAAAFLAALGYAVLRYHVFAAVPWERLPSFTSNKAVALTSVGALAAAYIHPVAALRLRLGVAGFSLAGAHVVLSLFLLGPDAYPRLYDGDRLGWAGLAGVVLGTLAGLALCVPAWATLPGVRARLGARWGTAQRVGVLALVLTALHVLPMGARGWLDPGSWPGALPPITLLSFVLAAWPVARRLRRPRA